MSTDIIPMQFIKSTKGTHVYGCGSSNPAIKTLYVQKDALPSTPPSTIKVTLEYGQ